MITQKESIQTNTVCSVYPNPFSSSINIVNLNSSILKVRLYDIIGRLVLKDEGLNIHEKEYTLSSLPDGIYQLEIETVNGFHCQRIVKTK